MFTLPPSCSSSLLPSLLPLPPSTPSFLGRPCCYCLILSFPLSCLSSLTRTTHTKGEEDKEVVVVVVEVEEEKEVLMEVEEEEEEEEEEKRRSSGRRGDLATRSI